MRKNKGITLIALVVTIVVLLILAVVSINIVFGDDGILGTAKKAADDTANRADYESNQLPDLMQAFIEESLGTTNKTEETPADGNFAPTFTTQAYASSAGTDTLTIQTVATDQDADNLTYTLNYGTTSSYGSTQTATGNSRKHSNI